MGPFRLATWNVNSIRTRLIAVLDWLQRERPDVVCLQETKAPDELFPRTPFEDIGYHVAVSGQKSYNGVATLARRPITNARAGFDGDPDPNQKRFLAVETDGLQVLNLYVPNGSSVGSDKFAYKLAWLRALRQFLDRNLTPQQAVVAVGDLNVALEERDVHDPLLWAGEVLFHPDARAALADLAAWGFEDLFRRHCAAAGQYTWWDYRVGAFRRNMGLRIDHVWASPPLAARSTACRIDVEPRRQPSPSDHAPVIADFA